MRVVFSLLYTYLKACVLRKERDKEQGKERYKEQGKERYKEQGEGEA